MWIMLEISNCARPGRVRRRRWTASRKRSLDKAKRCKTKRFSELAPETLPKAAVLPHPALFWLQFSDEGARLRGPEQRTMASEAFLWVSPQPSLSLAVPTRSQSSLPLLHMSALRLAWVLYFTHRPSWRGQRSEEWVQNREILETICAPLQAKGVFRFIHVLFTTVTSLISIFSNGNN